MTVPRWVVKATPATLWGFTACVCHNRWQAVQRASQKMPGSCSAQPGLGEM